MKIIVPISPESLGAFITEMRSESTDYICRKTMFKILKDSILKRLEEIR